MHVGTGVGLDVQRQVYQLNAYIGTSIEIHPIYYSDLASLFAYVSSDDDATYGNLQCAEHTESISLSRDIYLINSWCTVDVIIA